MVTQFVGKARNNHVAVSSTEAEYYALSATVREAIWVSQWIKQVFGVDQPFILYCDNQPAIQLTDHDVAHQRSKHIDIHYHFIRDYVQKGIIQVKWISTKHMHADILTKAMEPKQFQSIVSNNLLTN